MHYVKTIFKNLKTLGIVTIFNLLGLSVSFAAFLLLSIYLWNEFTYDRNNENYEQIYRLNIVSETNGEKDTQFTLPNPMADIIFESVPELENLCSFANGAYTYSKESDPTVGFKLNTKAVDSTFTDIFTIKIKSGSQSPLKGQKKIIISEKAATRIFGDVNPIGKVILANLSEPYTIDAVFYNLPNNSSFQYEAFCSYPTQDWVNEWSEWSFRHFFIINPNANFDEINKKILEIPVIKERFSEYEDYKFSFSFTPLKDLHFSKGDGTGNLLFSQILVFVAILLLFMAFVNYINFAVANAPKKIKSVSMRRVVGESRFNLLLLAVIESIILILVSFLIALFMCYIIIAFWQDIFGYPLILANHYALIFTNLILFITLGVFASIYPARMVTGVNPALALKGMMTFSAKNSASGKILTVIQYAISIILITGVLFIEKQVSFVKNYDLGFNKENILVIITTANIRKQEDAFVSELMKNPNIKNYAFSQFIPGGVGMGWGRMIDDKQVNFMCWPVDERYLDFMGFKIIKGRKFSENIDADENNFIFNQKAIDEFDWEEFSIGRKVPGFDFTGELVGIIKDVKYASLHEDVQPMAFWLTKTRHNRLSLKISGTNVSETIEYIKSVYENFEDGFPFNYSFLDDSLDAQYKAEEKQAELIFIFTIISILISIIGALGLIIFMTEYRIKEIGIRKVNGATAFEILMMLNKSFFQWILIAYVIATPLSYYLVKKWMESFAYKTDLSWWVFAIAGFITLLISLLVVSWQSWKAASRNPVDALRDE